MNPNCEVADFVSALKIYFLHKVSSLHTIATLSASYVSSQSQDSSVYIKENMIPLLQAWGLHVSHSGDVVCSAVWAYAADVWNHQHVRAVRRYFTRMVHSPIALEIEAYGDYVMRHGHYYAYKLYFFLYSVKTTIVHELYNLPVISEIVSDEIMLEWILFGSIGVIAGILVMYFFRKYLVAIILYPFKITYNIIKSVYNKIFVSGQL